MCEKKINIYKVLGTCRGTCGGIIFMGTCGGIIFMNLVMVLFLYNQFNNIHSIFIHNSVFDH